MDGAGQRGTAAGRRWLPVAVVVLAVLLLGWIVSSAELSSEAIPVPELDNLSQPAPSEPPDETASAKPIDATPQPIPRWHAPEWLTVAVTVLSYLLIGGIVVGFVGYLIHRLIHKPLPDDTSVETRAAGQPSVAELHEALVAALTDIDAGNDSRAAVIACWLRLERAAADAGVERLRSETPTDLVARVLAAHHVDEPTLATLADAYQWARYAPHDVSPQLRAAARDALHAVDAQLTARDHA